LTPAVAPPAGAFSTQPRVLDFDLELGAMKETRFHPNRWILATNFRSRAS
jgi:hypothetical protein